MYNPHFEVKAWIIQFGVYNRQIEVHNRQFEVYNQQIEVYNRQFEVYNRHIEVYNRQFKVSKLNIKNIYVALIRFHRHGIEKRIHFSEEFIGDALISRHIKLTGRSNQLHYNCYKNVYTGSHLT